MTAPARLDNWLRAERKLLGKTQITMDAKLEA
jgi:hypothetical protein